MLDFFQPGADGAPRIKICGFTKADEAAKAVELGVDALGINFWPKSKRFVEIETVSDWLGELAGQVTRIGLFVNATMDELEAVIDHGVLDSIQLHGDEPAEFVEDVTAFGLPVIRAVGMREDGPSEALAEIPTRHVLLDAWAPEERGGTGRTFRWDLARAVVEEETNRQIILAGGLTPANVGQAVQEVHPHAVDTASGVESAPGRKDAELMAQFVEACRSQ